MHLLVFCQLNLLLHLFHKIHSQNLAAIVRHLGNGIHMAIGTGRLFRGVARFGAYSLVFHMSVIYHRAIGRSAQKTAAAYENKFE